MPKYTPIIATAVTLGLIAGVGYIIPPKKEAYPDRVLLENIGGRVVFEHKLHAETYDVACAKCHHESLDPENNVQKCQNCHGVDFENPSFKAIHARFNPNEQGACATCHHLELEPSDWNHDRHNKDYDIACRDCHHKNLKIEPEPQNCSNCHQAVGTNFIPSIEVAVHTRCDKCHEEQLTLDNGCLYCHDPIRTLEVLKKNGSITFAKNFYDCRVCHKQERAQNFVSGRMKAFHDNCLACHEELKKGPFKKDDCEQCHIK